MAKKDLNKSIKIELINLSAGTQQRQLEPDVVSHYLDLAKDGIELPPIELIYSGTEYYVWDGFHRLAVGQKLRWSHIRANVEIGDLRRAVFMSYGANGHHGFPRQSGALRYILGKIFNDPEWSKKPVAEIARHVGCSRKHAFEVKNEVKCNLGGALNDRLNSVDTSDSPGTEAYPPVDHAKPGSRTETEPRSPLHDGEGNVVSSALADRFLSRSVIKDRINELDKIKNAVMNKIADGDLTYCLLNQAGFKNDMENLRARLKAAVPYAICCYCAGEGCGSCHESGFLNEASWKAAPKN